MGEVAVNIIVLSAVNGDNHPRTPLLWQTLDSLIKNATNPKNHTFTMTFDNGALEEWGSMNGGTWIFNGAKPGASACRNIGAASIPPYRRQDRVVFFDDDIYACPGWDTMLEHALDAFPDLVVSGHSHPFNQSIAKCRKDGLELDAAAVLSTVNIATPWHIWDQVGPFAEPGGPGGSEDVEWCARAAELGIGFAVTSPQCILHCGLTSSAGTQIVGHDLMVEQNNKLIEQYGLKGVIIQ